jgi:hypothetical protein
VVGVTTCHEPATGGVSVGAGERGLSGTENCTEMVASLGSPVVPSAGFIETMLSGPAEGGLIGADVGDAAARPAFVCTITAAALTPTTAKAIRTMARTQPFRPLGERACRDELECA